MNDHVQLIEASELTTDHDEAWHQQRQGGIGSSEVYELLSGGALDVYHRKTRPRGKKRDPINTGQLRGRILEPHIAEWYGKATGRGVRRAGQRQHPDKPWARAEPDRIIFADASRSAGFQGTGVLEVKAPFSYIYREILEDGIRSATTCQLFHQMFVMGYSWGSFSAGNLESDPPMVAFDVQRDDPFIELLEEFIERFWFEHVVAMVPPDPDEWDVLGSALLRDVQDIRIEHVLLSDEELREHAEKYLEAHALLKDAEKMKAEHREPLESHMKALATQKVTETWADPYKVSLSPSKPSESLDVDRLMAHRPLNFDAFVRRFSDTLGVEGARQVAAELMIDLDDFKVTKERSPTFRVHQRKPKPHELAKSKK